MVTFSTISLFVALRFFLLLVAPTTPVVAMPTPQATAASAGSGYWVSTIQRQGVVAFGDPSYKIFRNVKDFGAKGMLCSLVLCHLNRLTKVGDGSTDDTAAINSATSFGNRCGQGCDSSTVTPAIVYFPPGTYMVSKPLIQNYYTQYIGDAVHIPTIKALSSFQGMAVIDSDPYDNTGANWYTNQNNFFRQIRNFVIDLTAMPASSGAGIHWQVAQVMLS